MAFETPYDSVGIEELMNTTHTCTVTRGDHRSAFFIKNQVTQNSLRLPEQELASQANSARNLRIALDACYKMVGKRVNWLAVDFWSIGDVVEVVMEYNKGLGFAPPSEEPSMAPSIQPSSAPY